MRGQLYQMLAEDHRRMEGLLALAAADTGARGAGAYEEFRSALLRHIGMEENVLIPSARQACGGERLPMTDRIRLDHSALAALLVPAPNPGIIACLKAILSGHNQLEEGTDGLYETCERLAGDQCGVVLEKLRAYPIPRLKPHVSDPVVLEATRRALARAGYEWDELVKTVTGC